MGIDPPSPTSMVEIRTGLTFLFGPEGACKGSDEVPCGATGDVPLQFPKVSVTLEPFAIDSDEVTNFQFQYCVDKGGCKEGDPVSFNAVAQSQRDYYRTEQFKNFPVVFVTWKQADEYCKFVGKRLPTEIEWERVAKGGAAPRQFALEESLNVGSDCGGLLNALGCGGDQITEEAGQSDHDFVLENGSKIFHMASNVAEWTDTWYQIDMTCQMDAPCKRIDQCKTITDPTARTACENQTVSCPGCASVPASDGACYFQCDGTATRSIICNQFTATGIDPADILPTSGSDKVIRGGSVSTSRSQLCLLHSWNRDTRNSITFTSPSVGFRCAKTLQ
ncbi:MAG: SUMF1/EgtB/PvdO family nonheme iron enzyme [Myxococcota bacterium]